ncbi:ABC transporter substrate-binding protein [soil metagenome]
MNRTISKHFIRLVTIALAATALAQPARSQTKVTVGFATPIEATYAPQMFAEGMGFFKEEGLTVEYMSFKGAAVLLPQVVNGSLTFGFPNPDILILSRDEGKDPLPVKFFFNGTSRSIWELAVLDDSSIKSIEDLKGKKLGVGAMTFGNIPITRALLRDFGMTAGTDVELIPVGTGAPAFLALTSKKIDALNLWDAQHLTLENTGVKLRRLAIPEKYTSLFSNGWVAQNELYKKNPQLMAGFGRAMARGLVACQVNLAGCIENFWRMYPAQRPANDEAAQVENLKRVIGYRREQLFATVKTHTIGGYTDAAWRNFIGVLHASGQLKSTDIPVDQLYDGSFVEAFNSFDMDKTIALAKAFK